MHEKNNVVSGRSSADNRSTSVRLSSTCERAEASVSAVGLSDEVNGELLKALKQISGLWPEPPHCAEINPEWVGPNDGKMRAILLEAAIEIARKAIAKVEDGGAR